jgi:hypothetical protein
MRISQRKKKPTDNNPWASYLISNFKSQISNGAA